MVCASPSICSRWSRTLAAGPRLERSVMRTRLIGVPASVRWWPIVTLVFLAVSCTNTERVSQPIAFSHKQHVAKKLSCTFCHSGAEKHRLATIPSVTLCMGCHSVVKQDSPEIQKVRAYSLRRQEIPWRRIYQLPGTADVFFNHHRHAAAGVKCFVCHGDVGSRDRLGKEVEHIMGFCVQCHREHRAQFRPAALADDCATCHR